MSNNQAAWLKTAKANPLVVGPAPTPHPKAGEVVIKNASVAINPVDWKFQDWDPLKQKYPQILGKDIAGEIVEVGEGSRFEIGQRVTASPILKVDDDPAYGGFQLYTVVNELAVARIPDALPFSNAVVLPLALSTSVAGLYDYLALPLPAVPPKKTGNIIFVWGGSSSVGSTAIQLAVGSGLEVISTASKKNQNFVKSLGAAYVFDYAVDGVVGEIVKLIKSKNGNFVGALDAISTPETLSSTGAIVHQLGGGKIAAVHVVPQEKIPENVEAKFVTVSQSAIEKKDIIRAIWHDYVPVALSKGQLLAKPDPIIIKGGLSKVQEAIDLVKKGVSAAKVVVEL